MKTVATGLEVISDQPPARLSGRRLALLCNPASVNARLQHAREVIHGLYPGDLRLIFSPQHGFFAEQQDNMKESGHGTDPLLGIPVFSLYADTRRPTAEMMDRFDVLVVDIQDAGTRVYTFFSTLSHLMEAAAMAGKTVVVLDRPNPLGGLALEGNLLDLAWSSFVGRFAMPMRHGLTPGEAALWFNSMAGYGCDLRVVAMKGWRRSIYFDETGLPWIAPSPNLPTFASALVYPGQVIWEGTNVSEGRGTTLPFELVGAPFIRPYDLAQKLDPGDFPGTCLRPVIFQPTANKWADRACGGFQIHVQNRSRFNAYGTSLRLLQAVIREYPREFEYKKPPYEYEYERLPMDLILGDQKVRLAVEAMADMGEMEEKWRADAALFRQQVSPFLLYKK